MYHFALELGQLRNAFAVELFEVVVLGKSLKVPPYLLSVVKRQLLFKLLVYFLEVAVLQFQLVVKIILLVGQKVHASARFLAYFVYFIVELLECLLHLFLSWPLSKLFVHLVLEGVHALHKCL